MRRPHSTRGLGQSSRNSMFGAVAVLITCTLIATGQTPPVSVLPYPPGIPPAAETSHNPAAPRANAGFPILPTVSSSPARPATGDGSVKEFVEGISHNDAAFDVLVGQGRILTTKTDLAVRGKPSALVAVGDPSVVDFVIINARQIRLIGQRIGVTDLSITTPDNQTYSFEVRVVTDLHVLQSQLANIFPDTSIKLTQVRDHVVVEGQARDVAQVNRILETIRAYLVSVQTAQSRKVASQGSRDQGPTIPKADASPTPKDPTVPAPPPEALPEQGVQRSIQGTITAPRIVNLLRVPGSQQVLLKVRVAELNRTAFRQIGADFLATNRAGGIIAGTRIGGTSPTGGASAASGSLTGFAEALLTGNTTAFGIFERGDFALFFSALRRNSILKVLAEPNLVALNGHAASFLAGGEFPIPVPQGGGTGGASAITVQFREFGVRLSFLPTILDGDVIRLAVDPEVSSIDFSLGTVLVPGGSPVPGLTTRKVHTVVELREGQTLAMAGLLQLTLDGTTQRIPWLGDLPYIGPFFSNTSGSRVEKELVILVTPYLVEPMNPGHVLPTPGDDVETPSDCDLYLHKQIEARGSVNWQTPTAIETMTAPALLRLDSQHVRGPYGFTE